jgi:hypothetical protein
LPLADFGTVNFRAARARTASGQSGPITSPHWSAEPIALQEAEQATGALGVRFFGPRELVTAVPTVLADAGSAFAVASGQSDAPGAGGGGRVFPGVSA